MKKLLQQAILAGGAFVLAACHGDNPDPCAGSSNITHPTPGPPRVLIAPASKTFLPGDTATFVAVAVAFPDPECRDYPLTLGWTVSDTNVARIERDTGSSTLVRARGSGSATVSVIVIAQPTVTAAAQVNVMTP